MKIVMKFGGTSVADIGKIKNVANIIAEQRQTGFGSQVFLLLC